MAFRGYGNGYGNYGVGSDTSGNFPNTNSNGGSTSGYDPNADNFQNIMNILGRGMGAGLTAYGQGQENAADRLSNAYNNQASMAENQLQSDRNFGLTQATAANNANPIGTDQRYAQKQKLAQILLGGARNFSAQPGDPAVARAMGVVSGGLRLPQGGIDPSTINSLFGDNATQASIAQHEKQVGNIDPNSPSFDLSSIYGNSADGSQNAYQTDINTSRQNALNAQNSNLERQRAIIKNAIDNNIAAAKKGNHSGILGLLGSLGGSFMSALPMILAA